MDMKIILEHASSTKIPGGYHAKPVDPEGPVEVEVANVEDARVAFCSFIGRNGLSGYNLPAKSGSVVDLEGREIGRVCFNGTFSKGRSAQAAA